MLGWALLVNNLGRRRYPVYWWSTGKRFVAASKMEQRRELEFEQRQVESGLRETEGEAFDIDGDESAEVANANGDTNGVASNV